MHHSDRAGTASAAADKIAFVAVDKIASAVADSIHNPAAVHFPSLSSTFEE